MGHAREWLSIALKNGLKKKNLAKRNNKSFKGGGEYSLYLSKETEQHNKSLEVAKKSGSNSCKP